MTAAKQGLPIIFFRTPKAMHKRNFSAVHCGATLTCGSSDLISDADKPKFSFHRTDGYSDFDLY